MSPSFSMIVERVYPAPQKESTVFLLKRACLILPSRGKLCDLFAINAYSTCAAGVLHAIRIILILNTEFYATHTAQRDQAHRP